ncbi:isochorismate synthase [Nocardia neocaledoniensis NBRC 108232]|uniref:Isochorismate synthase n=1 Tax=Nocardia neocaledoniensis TaxID=236511 RepID=A0A317NMM0_9NOCA|nr:chorismate-binding protein [Nocardia neocaledoniensis]PWV76053.1 isochorismate synthase [Nocardia neocaledoniensis]GEM35227.1 isochorismate synthase [Nocardia neocaledoniensis NBRC 108232]
MNRFLLARPDGVLRASGMRASFPDPRRAAAALRKWPTGPEVGPKLIVGALPFDPGEPAALWQPESALHTAGPWRPAALPPLPEVRVVAQQPSPAEHMARVAALVERLGDPADELRKVVAARSVVVEAAQPLEPEVVAGQLLTRHPSASVYAVDLTAAGRPGETLLGATPEVLVTRHGDRVGLHPLAGTLPRLADPAADAAQAKELLASTKNHDEHAYVIDWIRERLTPVCAELNIPDGPELLGTEQVWHLATPIHGVLRDPSTTALDLALLLHPTPAVNGTPFAAALTAITTAERRGFYGGAVGWCAEDGDGEWVVAIRGAELSADLRTLRATAGGGIVAASEPRAELAETTAKFRTLLGALGCRLPED